MPTNPNMVAIETVTVGSGGTSSIDFTNIPQTYTDLCVKFSLRNTRNATQADLVVRFNNSTSNLSSRDLLGGGASGVSSNTYNTEGYIIVVPSANATANTFGNGEIYVPNYTSSNNKSVSADVVAETDAASAYSGFSAVLWSNSAAITSLKIQATQGNFVQYSTATLYGVTSAGYGAKATGGIITETATHYIHTFLSSGTFTPTQNLTAEYLVIAGGGGGGQRGGGGGGAGGYRCSVTGENSGGGASAESALSLTAQAYTVTVGAGGAGASTGSNGNAGSAGSNSVFSTITSTGGGGGGYFASESSPSVSGTTGGSGGGGGSRFTSTGGSSGGAATSNQGYTGGAGAQNLNNAGAGGGGGAGGTGGAGSGDTGGNGGAGVSSSITGSSVARGGGGGGAGNSVGTVSAGGGAGKTGTTNGDAGTANTGGGGGGGRNNTDGTSTTGGAGGSGIVVIRYAK